MSIEIIKEQIQDFLVRNTSEILSISGAWGIGKTYTWKNILEEFNFEEANKNKDDPFKKYAYVSLFGINSLESLKNAIVLNTVDINKIKTEQDIDNELSSIRKIMNKISNIPIINKFTPKLADVADLLIKKTIICIEDLERKGDAVKIKEILGLISYLKEQKNCKIVLLLNKDADCDVLKEFRTYSEKVIDIHLEFTPSASDCAAIAFNPESDLYITLCEKTKKLNITNIRILKKIEKLVNLAKPYMVSCEDEVKDQFINSLTLFTWCHLNEGNSEIPTLDFAISFYIPIFDEDEDEDDDNKKSWRKLIQNYGYVATDELDIVLAKAVRTGYFIDEETKLAVTHISKSIIASKSKDSFFNAWGLYHQSFDNNESAVFDSIYQNFKSNVQYISPQNLNDTVKFFRDLDKEEEANELIDFYIKERKNINQFNLEDFPAYTSYDEELVKRFENAYRELDISENAKQVLERITKSDSWRAADQNTLANTTVDEYYQLFKSENGSHLPSYVKKCLEFGQIAGDGYDQRLQITERAREALLKIAKESKINRIRVTQKYRITIEEAQN